MTVDVNRLRMLLNAEEPPYDAIARMGAAILPALSRFVSGPDAKLASKAASAAGMINDPRAADVLRQAARSRAPEVRIAAAGATRTLRVPGLSQVILALTRDPDPGVRKFAIKSAASRPGDTALAARVRELQTRDPSPTIRALASRAVRSPGNGRIG